MPLIYRLLLLEYFVHFYMKPLTKLRAVLCNFTRGGSLTGEVACEFHVILPAVILESRPWTAGCIIWKLQARSHETAGSNAVSSWNTVHALGMQNYANLGQTWGNPHVHLRKSYMRNTQVNTLALTDKITCACRQRRKIECYSKLHATRKKFCFVFQVNLPALFPQCCTYC